MATTAKRSDPAATVLGITKSEVPIFEIVTPNNHYRIYYSGRVDGLQERATSITNRLPLFVRLGVLLTVDEPKQKPE